MMTLLFVSIKPCFLDGIVFPSIQHSNGTNIVLFYKASKVKKLDLDPRTKVSAELEIHDENRSYSSYVIVEEKPMEGEVKEEPIPYLKNFSKPQVDTRIDTLEIDREHISIYHVNSVRYKAKKHDVTFCSYQINVDDLDDV
jgi:hypothetical protein